MVINDKYRFVFFHVPKAAGTSVTHALLALAGNNDRLVAETKHETLGQLSAAWRKRRSPSFKVNLDEYFRFGFVRNPFVRMHSFYTYLKEKRPRPEIESIPSFRHFLQQSCDPISWINGLHSMKPQLDYFTTADRSLEMGFVGHFEYLHEDLRSIESHLGVEIPIRHLNRSSSAETDYRESYDQETVEIVSSRFKDDLQEFGYTFESSHPTNRCSGRLCRRR